MKPGTIVFIAILLGIPVWLLARSWRRYLRLGSVPSGELFQMRAGIALISITTCVWIAVLALMTLEDYSDGAKTIARSLSPGALAFVNLILCGGAMVCARLKRAAAQDSFRLRSAIAANSGFLMLMWLFVAANPH